MIAMKWWRAVLGAALLVVGAGCGEKKWNMNEQVEGTVKLDGTPLRNVRVEFVPDVDPKIQAPTSSGYTDDKGHFQLTCTNQKPGAVIGKHNVIVLGGRPGGEEKVTYVPAAYGLAISTPCQVEVTADKHAYDLPLSRSARPRQ
jgi:hypothetical protein